MTELWKANIRLSKAPWESRRRREIPTFPQLRRRVVLLERKRTQKEKTEGRLHKKLDTARDLKDSVEDFSKAVQGSTPQDVMQLVLMTQYFDTLKEIAEGVKRAV